MWSVGISVSTSTEAARLGYDDRQINRIVIRMAQYFLDRDMRVIFGHDWREDGVMRAVADFAGVVGARVGAVEERERTQRSVDPGKLAEERMINVVPAGRDSLSGAAVAAELDSGGVLRVIPVSEAREHVSEQAQSAVRIPDVDWVDPRVAQLTELRHWLTVLLDPGCRVCMGGVTDGFQGREPGVIEEAELALRYRKPVYLLGGFGGATRAFGIEQKRHGVGYWHAKNGLSMKEKAELFETTDVERGIRLIWRGIRGLLVRERSCGRREGASSSAVGLFVGGRGPGKRGVRQDRLPGAKGDGRVRQGGAADVEIG